MTAEAVDARREKITTRLPGFREAIDCILDPSVLAEGNNYRDLARDSASTTIASYPVFRDACQKVYMTSVVILDNITRSKIKRMPVYPLGEIADIFQSQHERLWRVIAMSFQWSKYIDRNERAAIAFVSYIKKLGLYEFFSRQIESQCEITSSASLSDDFMSPEDCLSKKEERERFCRVVEQWAKTHDKPVVRTMWLRFWEGKTTEEIAEEEGLPTGTIKGQIGDGKRSLVQELISAGLFDPGRGITRGGYGVVSRRELLELRRATYALRYATLVEEGLLPDKVALALAVFYGFGTYQPIFDYQMTAERTGLSLQSVRVYIPQGTRMLAGSEPPSLRNVIRNEGKQLYLSWLSGCDRYAISPNQAEVLEMYYGLGISCREIAERLNVSPMTVSRLKQQALNQILLVLNVNQSSATI